MCQYCAFHFFPCKNFFVRGKVLLSFKNQTLQQRNSISPTGYSAPGNYFFSFLAVFRKASTSPSHMLHGCLPASLAGIRTAKPTAWNHSYSCVYGWAGSLQVRDKIFQTHSLIGWSIPKEWPIWGKTEHFKQKMKRGWHETNNVFFEILLIPADKPTNQTMDRAENICSFFLPLFSCLFLPLSIVSLVWV